MNDENVKIVVCDCGQPNHLILQDGHWIFDEKKHGRYIYPPNDETARGCINCHKSFVDKPAENKVTTADEASVSPAKADKKTRKPKTNL